MAQFRILIVDDFAPFRDVLYSIVAEIDALPAVRLICEVADGLMAVHEAERLQPELILLDIGLPGLNGVQAAQRIRAVAPESKLIFVSSHCAAELIDEVMSQGANGYVIKSHVVPDLSAAIQAVMAGRQFISEIGVTGSVEP